MRCYIERGKLLDIPDEEPLFVLRGQDVLAPEIVEAWADAAEKAGVTSSKVSEARRWAQTMREWPVKKVPD